LGVGGAEFLKHHRARGGGGRESLLTLNFHVLNSQSIFD